MQSYGSFEGAAVYNDEASRAEEEDDDESMGDADVDRERKKRKRDLVSAELLSELAAAYTSEPACELDGQLRNPVPMFAPDLHSNARLYTCLAR